MKSQALSFSTAAEKDAAMRAALKMNLWAGVLALVCCSVLEASAAAAVYEPFAQNAGSISGKAGGTGLNNWAVAGTVSTVATTPTLSYGQLPFRAGQVSVPSGGDVSAYVTTTTALFSAGLLNDGATLWFSFLYRKTSGGGSNERSGFAFGTDRLGLISTFGASMLNSGNGLGMYSRDKGIQPSVWVGGGSGTQGAGTSFANYGDTVLVVGRIVWGATSGDVETITLWTPNLASLPDAAGLGAGWSQTMTGVDQTAFDTISMHQRDSAGEQTYDELRFGATYNDVIGGARAFWDINGATAGAGGATPNGTWDAATANWSATNAGTVSTTAWTAGAPAVFAAGTDATGTYTVTVDGTQDIGGLIFEEGAVTLTNGTALKMVSDASAFVGSGLTATIATPISQDATPRVISKSGSGTLVLSGDNSGATGGMVIHQGITQFESLSSINGSGQNVIVNLGGVILLGSSFGAGNISTALGRIATGSTGTITADNYAGTDFNFSTAGLTAASLGAVGTVNYTGTLTPNGTTYRLGGGGGTLKLNSACTPVIVSLPGTIQFNGFDATVTGFAGTGKVVLENGSATTPVTLTITNAAAVTYSGDLRDGAGSQSLSLVKMGAGALTLTGTNNTYSGMTTLNAGTLEGNVTVTSLTPVSPFGVSSLLLNAGTLNLIAPGNNNSTTETITFGNDLTVSSNVTIYAARPYGFSSVNKTIRLGTLSIGSNTLTIDGAMISYYLAFSGVNLTGDAIISFADSYLPLTVGAITQSGGARSLTKAGDNGSTLRIAGTSDYTGATTISSGTLQLGNGGATGSLAGTSAITNNANLTINRTNTFTQATDLNNKAIAGRGSFTQAGTGTTVLSVDNSFSGSTTVSGGTLVLAGSKCLSDTNVLSIAAGKKVQLETGVKERVGALVLAGVTNTAPATWGSTNSVADIKTNFFLGPGLLYVNLDPPSGGTLIMIQ
jgi:autotransporter-associated beta strand protein